MSNTPPSREGDGLSSLYERIQAKEFETKLPYPAYKDIRGDMEGARAQRDAYSADNHRLHILFKSEAMRLSGLDQHPKGELVWQKAWDVGHSSGHSAVLSELEELAELVID